MRSPLYLFLAVNFCFGAQAASEKKDLNSSPKESLGTASKTGGLRGNGMQFIENKGQIIDMNNNLRPDILFKGDGGGTEIYIRKTGISYVLNNLGELTEEVKTKIEALPEYYLMSKADKQQKAKELGMGNQVRTQRVDMDFEGANLEAPIEKYDKLEGYTNYYYAHCPNGILNVSSFNRITQKNIYENIDIVYYGGKEKGLKYDIVVNPGGDLQQLKLKYSGADEVKLVDGNLHIETGFGLLQEFMPKVYQVIEGKIIDVKSTYQLLQGSTYSLKTAAYNLNYPLIIDPWVTYYGGTSVDYSGSINTDNAGNVVITGTTFSVNFPVTAGAFQAAYAGGAGYDAIVVKFSPLGARLWATYYGGTGAEDSNDIVADNTGNIVITGGTGSTNFPVTAGAFQTANGGVADAFVVKFNTAGAQIWATYYGGATSANGSGGDHGSGIATDNTGNIVIVGSTQSTNLPVLAGFQMTYGGGTPYMEGDAFVVKFDPAGTPLWASFYGGSARDDGFDIATDNADNIVISGNTSAVSISGGTVANFPPATAGAYQTGNAGAVVWYEGDAFVAKFSSTGTRLWATFYGGSLGDAASSIATDTADNIIITGITSSTDFPVTAGAYQTVYGGGTYDLFFVKFNSAGTRLWATYYGGTAWDIGSSCATDANNNIYLLGEWEEGNVPNFPLQPCALQKTFGGEEDQFIVKLNGNGQWLCSTYLGGPGEDDLDYGGGIACYGGFIYFTLQTPGFYPVTANAYQSTFSGVPSTASGAVYHSGSGSKSDIIVGKICGTSCGDTSAVKSAFVSSVNNVCTNIPVAFTQTIVKCDTSNIKYQWTFQGGTPGTSSQANPAGITWQGSGTYNVKLVVQTPCGDDSIVKPAFITITPCGLSVQATGQSVCAGSCATVSALGTNGTAPYTYSWSNGSSAQIINVCPTGSTVYTIIVSDGTGATTTSTATVIIPSQLNTMPALTNISCNGGSNGIASANPSGGNPPYRYSWSNNSTQSTINNLSQGTYTLSIADASGCITNTVVTITEPLVLSVVTNTTTANCSQGSGSAMVSPSGGTGPYTYLWSASGGNATTQQISNLSSATYSVTITDNNGCTLVTAIAIGNMPGVTAQLSASASASCYGNCNGLASVSGNGGTSPYTYLWSNGDTHASASNLCTAAYTATITDAAGCFSATNVTIAEPSQISLLTSHLDVSCNAGNNGSVTVNASGATGPYTYLWSNQFTTSLINSITQLSAGLYTVTITDAGGCSADTTISITEPAALSYTIATSDETCGQGNGTSTIHLTGGTRGYYYFWFTASGGGGNNDSTLVNQVAGTYTVYVQDNNGCTIQTMATINNIGNIVTHSQNMNACDSANINNRWYYNTQIISDTLANATITGCDSIVTTNLTVAGFINTYGNLNSCSGQSILIHGQPQSVAGVYTQTFSSASGGCDSVSSITLNIQNNLIVDMGNDTTLTSGTSITLSATTNATGNILYQWSTGETTQSINAQPTITTQFIVTITDEYGCTIHDTITITINNLCDDYTAEVFVPNSFSPNGDGQNDILKLYSRATPETIYFAIYNRWGEKVFETTDFGGTWDGKYKNKLADTAVFTWVLKITCDGATAEVVKSGNISLMR